LKLQTECFSKSGSDDVLNGSDKVIGGKFQ